MTSAHKRVLRVAAASSLLLAAAIAASAQSAGPARTLAGSIDRGRAIVGDVVAASYPELRNADIRIKPFTSDFDYFRARFSILRILFHPRMQYVVLVNPRLFELNAPEDGVRAIVAHELAHILYYKKRNRLELLGLVRLASHGFSARFERRADLEAISRGYAEGLKEYRRWLYLNIPPSKLGEKRRNYFSPGEIDAIEQAIRKRPELMSQWRKHVPLSLEEIEMAGNNPLP